LGKIAKGKYLKSMHTVIIQPEEESSLKLMALETMTSMVKTCHEYMIACDTALNANNLGGAEENKSPGIGKKERTRLSNRAR